MYAQNTANGQCAPFAAGAANEVANASAGTVLSDGVGNPGS